MKLPAPVERNFENAPAGNHLAVCYRILDLGTQETSYGPKRLIQFGWELAHETMENGEPYMINSKKMNFSGNEESNLRLMLESWRGRRFTQQDFAVFEIESVIGAACMLNIIHVEVDGKTFANVSSVAPVPKGMEKPALQNDAVFLSLDDFKEAVYNGLSSYYQEEIAKSPEFAKVAFGGGGATHKPATAEETAAAQEDGDIPF